MSLRVMLQSAAFVTVDLGGVYRVSAATLWHYYGDDRSYCQQKLALSLTGTLLKVNIMAALSRSSLFIFSFLFLFFLFTFVSMEALNRSCFVFVFVFVFEFVFLSLFFSCSS